jgi:hypothetical protein
MFRAPATESPVGDSRSQARESDGRIFHLREQAGRCRRLARDSTDPNLRDRLFRLAEEYAARASAQETEDTAVWRADLDDDSAA